MSVIRNISMFDWNGNTAEEMVQDAEKFGFKILNSEEGDMGFLAYELEGEPEALDAFVNYYELEWDDE